MKSLFYKNTKVSTRDWTEIILVDFEMHWGSVSNIPRIIEFCLGKHFGGKSDIASPLPRPCWVWKWQVFITENIFHGKCTIEIISKYQCFWFVNDMKSMRNQTRLWNGNFYKNFLLLNSLGYVSIINFYNICLYFDIYAIYYQCFTLHV